ncbi:hypothetical protein PROFUN_08862 [Planoprotostelium fungivorum]|uniref:Uncharacterized protein n=1 Tax=Planoprotostelium fungivorum TaxID=1890364 RepID=A0A2P6NIZ2_9EUKA|nr:hypothetical protein PROFUN_08862 [Planoprotostelium fungivorum]
MHHSIQEDVALLGTKERVSKIASRVTNAFLLVVIIGLLTTTLVLSRSADSLKEAPPTLKVKLEVNTSYFMPQVNAPYMSGARFALSPYTNNTICTYFLKNSGATRGLAPISLVTARCGLIGVYGYFSLGYDYTKGNAAILPYGAEDYRFFVNATSLTQQNQPDLNIGKHDVCSVGLVNNNVTCSWNVTTYNNNTMWAFSTMSLANRQQWIVWPTTGTPACLPSSDQRSLNLSPNLNGFPPCNGLWSLSNVTWKAPPTAFDLQKDPGQD